MRIYSNIEILSTKYFIVKSYSLNALYSLLENSISHLTDESADFHNIA